jgi:uncharacterized protein (TIGR03067 family)
MKANFFKYLTILLVLILSGSPSNSQDKSKEIQKVQDDMKVLQGDWICIMEELGGQPYTKEKVKEMNKRMNVDKNSMIIKRVIGGKSGTYEGKFELDPTTKPKKFDFTGKGPAGANVEMKGIYELTENEFKVIYVQKGLRPKEFKTVKGEAGVYVQYKRDKD